MVDMTKHEKAPEPVKEETPKEQIFNIGLTIEEVDTIRRALATSKSIEMFMAANQGAKEYEILVALNKIK